MAHDRDLLLDYLPYKVDLVFIRSDLTGNERRFCSSSPPGRVIMNPISGRVILNPIPGRVILNPIPGRVILSPISARGLMLRATGGWALGSP